MSYASICQILNETEGHSKSLLSKPFPIITYLMMQDVFPCDVQVVDKPICVEYTRTIQTLWFP